MSPLMKLSVKGKKFKKAKTFKSSSKTRPVRKKARLIESVTNPSLGLDIDSEYYFLCVLYKGMEWL